MDITVHFSGPYSWPGVPGAPSVFDVEEGRRFGVYLWTVPNADSNNVYYVGETGRSFRDRLYDHYKEHAAGMYHLYDAGEFAIGKKAMFWPGRYDKGDLKRSITQCIAEYQRLSTVIAETAHLYRFFLAPLLCERRERTRIEGAISDALRLALGGANDLQEKGIRYVRRANTEDAFDCIVTSTAPILGLPSRVRA